MTPQLQNALLKARNDLRETAPLIHCITNPIAINDCANGILAVGGKPIMAEHPDEVEEITCIAGALGVNIGNITDARRTSVLTSAKAAKTAGVPVSFDAVGVTFGPGLVGALLTGVSWAKAFAYARRLPLIAVNHIEGHVSANFVANPELEPPFVCLVASGGHSHIVSVERYGAYKMLGRTTDDAAGEAFDKAARVLNIPYPGGPLLDKLAEEGNPEAYRFPKIHTEGKYDFSFSGLKTAVINQAHMLRQKGEEIRVADWSASLRKAVVDMLVDKTLAACRDTGAKSVALAGGVASNRLLRREMERRGTKMGLKVYMPPVALCTDNAVMIGSAAFYRLMTDEPAPLSLNAQPSIRLIEE